MSSYIPYHLKSQNRKMIYDLFHEKKISSRAEIVRLTGISFPTVLKIVDRLLELHIITELDELERLSGAGRRGHLLRFNPNAYMTVGVQFDGNHAFLGLVNMDGDVFSPITRPLHLRIHDFLDNKTSPQENQILIEQLFQISQTIHNLHAQTQKNGIPVLGIGIGLPCMVNPKNNSVLHINPDSSLTEIPFSSIFPKFTDSLSLPYCLGNDVNMASQGEAFLRNPIHHPSDLVYITLGAGCGAGILQKGELWYGGSFHSGEIGHLPLFSEGTCASGAVIKLSDKINLSALQDRFHIHLEDMPTLWKDDPKLTEEICDYLCPYLGYLFLTMHLILDIKTCVLTGPIPTALGSLLLEKTRSQLLSLHDTVPFVLESPIQPTSHLTGASVSVFQKCFEELLNK